MKKLSIVFLGLFAAHFAAFAQKPAVVTTNEPGWHKIGEISASFKKQNESIVVLGADEFTSIKLKVTEASLNIDRLQVFYESGDMEEIDVRKELKQGTETRSIKLKHPDRDINKIAFTYKTIANSEGEKAHVELYGLKTNQPAGSDSYNEAKNTAEETKQEIREENAEIKAEAKEDAKIAADKAGSVSHDASNGISEAAARVMANIKDKRHADKVGPNGQTIFIDNSDKLYFIDNAGNKVFVTEMELKDKPKD